MLSRDMSLGCSPGMPSWSLVGQKIQGKIARSLAGYPKSEIPNMKHDIKALQSGYVDTDFLAIRNFPVKKNYTCVWCGREKWAKFFAFFGYIPIILLTSNTGSLGQRTRFFSFHAWGNPWNPSYDGHFFSNRPNWTDLVFGFWLFWDGWVTKVHCDNHRILLALVCATLLMETMALVTLLGSIYFT